MQQVNMTINRHKKGLHISRSYSLENCWNLTQKFFGKEILGRAFFFWQRDSMGSFFAFQKAYGFSSSGFWLVVDVLISIQF